MRHLRCHHPEVDKADGDWFCLPPAVQGRERPRCGLDVRGAHPAVPAAVPHGGGRCRGPRVPAAQLPAVCGQRPAAPRRREWGGGLPNMGLASLAQVFRWFDAMGVTYSQFRHQYDPRWPKELVPCTVFWYSFCHETWWFVSKAEKLSVTLFIFLKD